MKTAVAELVDTKFKRISLGVTTLLFILLFILFFLVSWTIPDPMPEVEPRIEIIPVEFMDNQGSTEGQDGGSPNDTPFEKPVSTENTKPTPNTSPKVTTQETSTASVPTGTNNNTTPTVNQNALFTKPTGNGNGTGDGNNDGPGTGIGNNGPGNNGHSTGTIGTGYSLSGRSALDKPAPKNVTLKEGKIVINIWVDRDGKVIRTKFNPDLSTINDSRLTEECEKAAKKTVWSENEDADDEQKGSITYNFKLN